MVPNSPTSSYTGNRRRRSPWRIQRAVVYALFLREMKTRFGSKRLGYFWAILEPAAIIIVFWAMFGLAMRGGLTGVDYTMFLLTGMLPYQLFANIVNKSMAAFEANQGLFNYRQVKPLDTLITHVDVQRAHESDANALIPAIESTQENELAPKELLADSLYASDEKVETAKAKGIEVVAPPTGSEKRGRLGLSDFHLEKSGKVVVCPEGQAPLYFKKKKTRHCTLFDPLHCNDCPNRAICPASKGKKAFYLLVTDKKMRIALRRSAVYTDEFKDRYHWRAGVEATMSEFDRWNCVKRLRERGSKAVRFNSILKAVRFNILRAAAVMAATLAVISETIAATGSNRNDINVFKEQFRAMFALFARLRGHMLIFSVYAH